MQNPKSGRQRGDVASIHGGQILLAPGPGLQGGPQFGFSNVLKYRARNKGLQMLLSNSQAGPGTTAKQEQEEISRNHVQAFFPGPVQRYTGLGKRVIPRLRESRLLTPSGRGA